MSQKNTRPQKISHRYKLHDWQHGFDSYLSWNDDFVHGLVDGRKWSLIKPGVTKLFKVKHRGRINALLADYIEFFLLACLSILSSLRRQDILSPLHNEWTHSWKANKFIWGGPGKNQPKLRYSNYVNKSLHKSSSI